MDTIDTTKEITTGNLENSKENSSWGGARENAGRKKGSENEETKKKKVAKKEMIERIIRSKDALLNAQLNLAQGVQMLFKIEKEITEEGKERKSKPILVTNQEEIEDYLAGEYEEGKDYYFITTERPDNKALDSLFDRAFDKSKQPLVGGDEDDKPIEFIWKSQSTTPQENGQNSSTTPSQDGLS
jgi:hypothetical protein